MDLSPSTPSKKELSHQRIVEVASRAIRRAGYDGVGVADIMKEAGLTHGGFYAHFDSRAALLAEALGHAGRASGASFAEHVQARRAAGETALRVVIETYLSEAHRVGAELGCPVAALSSEMPRQAPALQEAGAERVRALVATVRQALDGETADDDAQVIAATMVGALQLARVLGPESGGELLAATRASLLARYERS
ncbi:TetR/AcrR family transcriptional regulator [Roseateles violae]|uniref:TetR/AcrR family transcriptional regulator n=1 Tax=Roseateles violae TaxID=3058042 RepID=A0ABT8DUD6_9BURK|nr:TetR/AcrR family transcriptional regulator [Pelomonas sp. PFR6]MDN3921920.1 TetR/AcrR family transcriptional regulator [Pelomonas sp. PFR6]